MEIRPTTPPLNEPARVAQSLAHVAQLTHTVSARPVVPVDRTQPTAAEAQPDRTAGRELQAHTRMLVELDPDSGVFIRRILDADTGAQLAQFPNKVTLAFSRAIADELRRQIDMRA